MPLWWRPDGDLVKDVPHTHRIMPYIMRGRNQSLVFFEQSIDPTRMDAFIQDFREKTGLKATPLHLMIWAGAHVLEKRPRLNRFTAGGRIWQRRGIWISFSAKKAKNDDAPVVALKKKIDPSWSFRRVVEEMTGVIDEGRSDKKSSTDKELALLFLLPSLILMFLAKLLDWLNDFGLLPGAFMRDDPMFASVFIANLGSIDMDAGFHHLYEYGNIPIFLLAGAKRQTVVPGPDNTPIIAPRMTFRYTFDERVEDGLYCAQSLDIFKEILENPRDYIRE